MCWNNSGNILSLLNLFVQFLKFFVKIISTAYNRPHSRAHLWLEGSQQNTKMKGKAFVAEIVKQY